MKLAARIVSMLLLISVPAVAANKASGSGVFEECIRKGMAFEAKGDSNNAYSLYTKAITVNPKNSSGHYQRGRLLRRAADAEQSAGQYERAVELFNMAIVDLSKAITLNGSHLDAYRDRAAVYRAMEQPIAAIADCNKVLASKPDDAETYYLRGNLEGRYGDASKAVSDFNLALKYNPGLKQVYYSRGAAYCVLEDFKKAIADFDTSLKSYPDAIQTYMVKGIACESSGQLEEALKTYRKGLTVVPEDSSVSPNEIVAMVVKMRFKVDALEKELAKTK